MDELRIAVAATARRCVRAGLIEAFGHVSARGPAGIAITGVQPLGDCRPEEVIVLDPAGRVVAGPGDDLPLETALHLAIYARRTDVHGICRGHPPAAVRWGIGREPLPLRHGLGAIAGHDVRVHPDPQLVVDQDAAAAAASSLGQSHGLLLQANGALAVGAGPVEAATRLWFLEERAGVALETAGIAPAPVDWKRRERHTAAELRRATAWFLATYNDRDDAA